MPTLFDPLVLGEIQIPNRIVMAPMTRTRAGGAGRIPNSMMRDYYAQRASAGLIITEATCVSPSGVGYPRTPGIWSQEQIDGWRDVVNAVHLAGGRILLQLWHVGRISDPLYHNGELPIAPSEVAAAGHVNLLRPLRPYVTPRSLLLEEIPAVVEEFRVAAENALSAGFDGIEVHGANGYLLDQFLQDRTNRRTDAYGASVENRSRLMLEVADAVISVWGAGRVGFHLAPRGDVNDMGDSNPAPVFRYVARELGMRKIAFLCVRESNELPRLGPQLRADFGGVYIANEGYTRESAEAALEQGEADAVAFGQLFISNPDLPRRFREGAALASSNNESFYTAGPQGYIDYPALG